MGLCMDQDLLGLMLWDGSEIAEQFVLLLNLEIISHASWNETQGIFLLHLNRKLLLY